MNLSTKIKQSILPIIITISLTLCQYGIAQDTTSTLANITIQAQRIDIQFSEQSRSISVINRSQIEQLEAQSINELLQTITGVDIRQRGINGVQADVSIRGGTFEQTLILINGIKMIDPQTGHHMMNIPLTMEDIERVEILKGPGARVYGQNAFSGAINIVTKTNDEFGIHAGIEYGEHHLFNSHISLDVPVGNYQQRISVSRNQSDSVRYNTDYDITNLFYQGDGHIENLNYQIIAGHSARNFGANGFYGSPRFRDQYEETRTTFASLATSSQIANWKITPRFSWRRNKDNWQFNRSNPEVFQNFHTTDVYRGEIQNKFTHQYGILGVGLEYDYIDIMSNNLGDRSRTQIGFHLENRFLFNNDLLDITPGIYVLKISDYRTQYYPGIDIGLQISPSVRLYTNYGHTSRIPTYTDLYYEDSGNLGNPKLQIESANAVEIGINKSNRMSNVSAVLFYRKSNQLIDWFKESEEDKWMPDNFGNASYFGIETSYRKQYHKQYFIKYWQLGYQYLNAKLGENNVSFSRNRLENLRHQVVAQVNFRISKAVSLNTIAKYNDRVSLDDYFLMDLNLSYKHNSTKLYLRANNITNIEYRETNLVPMPGRWISIGVKASVF